MRTPKAFKPRPQRVDHQAMAPIQAIRGRLVRLLRSEQGMALPVALFAMIATMALASAAVLASIDVQQGSTRDNSSKKAIAAADAGSSVALLRLNRFKSSLSTATPCVGPAGESLKPTGGWCPAITPEPVGKSTYSYMISAYQVGAELKLVSVGTAQDVSRRVMVNLTTTEGENIFAEEKMVAKGDIEMGGAFFIESDIGTNGTVHKNGGGDVCGDVRHGPGKGNNVTPQCNGKVTEGEREVPEVVPPTGIATLNSNCRLTWTCAISTEKDLTCNEKNECSQPIWDPKTRTLEDGGNKTNLTLGGGDYFVCRLLIHQGQMIMAKGAHVRIFFDSPENCPNSKGTPPMEAGAIRFEIGTTAQVTATGYNEAAGEYDVPGLYFLGSETIPTSINLQAQGGANEMILYAPNVDISMNGRTHIYRNDGRQNNHHPGQPGVQIEPQHQTARHQTRHPLRPQPLRRVHGRDGYPARRELLIPARRSSSRPILPS